MLTREGVTIRTDLIGRAVAVMESVTSRAQIPAAHQYGRLVIRELRKDIQRAMRFLPSADRRYGYVRLMGVLDSADKNISIAEQRMARRCHMGGRINDGEVRHG